jgi:hypothetical protein
MSFHRGDHHVIGGVKILRVLKTHGRAALYKLNRGAFLRDIKNQARKGQLPFLPVYLVVNFTRRPWALQKVAFPQVFRPASVPQWPWPQVQLREP